MKVLVDQMTVENLTKRLRLMKKVLSDVKSLVNEDLSDVTDDTCTNDSSFNITKLKAVDSHSDDTSDSKPSRINILNHVNNNLSSSSVWSYYNGTSNCSDQQFTSMINDTSNSVDSFTKNLLDSSNLNVGPDSVTLKDPQVNWVNNDKLTSTQNDVNCPNYKFYDHISDKSLTSLTSTHDWPKDYYSIDFSESSKDSSKTKNQLPLLKLDSTNSLRLLINISISANHFNSSESSIDDSIAINVKSFENHIVKTIAEELRQLGYTVVIESNTMTISIKSK